VELTLSVHDASMLLFLSYNHSLCCAVDVPIDSCWSWCVFGVLTATQITRTCRQSHAAPASSLSRYSFNAVSTSAQLVHSSILHPQSTSLPPTIHTPAQIQLNSTQHASDRCDICTFPADRRCLTRRRPLQRGPLDPRDSHSLDPRSIIAA
jgi:hypothetical protein